MTNQTYNWKSESKRYLLKSLNSKNNSNNQYIDDHLRRSFKNKNIYNVLDVGWGGGNFLDSLIINNKVKKFGIETSIVAVNALKKNIRNIIF